jgi:uncharacterized protein (TIGR02679 family)
MKCDHARLQTTLGRPELTRLVQRLRSRLERGRPLTGTLALPDASDAERDAINRLLGRVPTRGNTAAVSLDQLEDKLRAAGVCPSLQAAVEELTGPVVDLRAKREMVESRWTALFAAASNKIAPRPELKNWLDQLRATGLLRRYGIADAERLLSQALEVVAALPAQDTPLAELAAATLGDAHALDPDTSLGSIVLRAAAALGKCEKWDDVQSRRDAWASVGVICDELSAPILVLNLRASENTPTSQALAAYAAIGEPAYLSVRQLLRTPPTFSHERVGPVVYICENPNVVAAAAQRLGAKSQPLVCIEGQPRTATRLLLNRLQNAGVPLAYHGDFDWPGIQIANTIIQRHSAQPWRMSVTDYRTAAIGQLALEGPAVAATWDEGLMPVMREVGKAVHEEQVIETLLTDLARRHAG